jgi:cysteine desulfurase
VGSVYLDAAAGVPLHPAAAEALTAAVADGWADPAKLYGAGRRSSLLLDGAREEIAEVLGARPDELAFCGSGTQAAHLAILGGLAGRRRAGTRFVHSAVEHSCVLHAAERHAAAGGEAVSVPVDRDGRVDVAAFAAAADGAALASLMTANHEVGTLQPVAEVAAACRDLGVPLHTDAAQSAGRLPVPAGWSLLSASAHKWGGPPGVGVLAVRTGTRWRSPLPADERERGRVPGFPNVPAAVAAAAALRAVRTEAAAENARLSALVDRIRAEVAARVPDVEVVGPATGRLPHLVTFSCLYVDGEALLHELDRRGFAVSSGSSCTSSTLTPSHVLEAMGVLSHGNVRVSLHRDTTEADVDRFLAVLPGIVADLRTGLEGL